MLIQQAFKWFVPAELRASSLDRQARRAVLFGLAMMIWSPVFAPIFYLLGSPRGGVIVVCSGASIFAATASMRLTRSVGVTGHLIAAAVFTTLVGLATVTGGTGSPSLWWLPAVPIIGLILCGVSAGVIWSAISCTACLGFLLLDQFNIALAEDIGREQMRLLNAAGTSGIILCAFSLTLTFKLGEDAARRDLEAARLESDQANQAKSEFLANMSHEIRTPMNAVIGLTELVLETELPTKQRDYLSTVLESGESLLSIINEILDFSKIEAGKMELEFVSFALREELGESMKSLALRAHRKQLELVWYVDADVPEFVVGDSTRLRQILVNLAGNAIKFTESGEVVVGVKRKSGGETRVVLCFEIRDTGVGIRREKLDAIFSPFEQADTSTTREFGGTGLGLSISSRLVDLMGGHIEVESEVGKGSVFRFSIPMPCSNKPSGSDSKPDQACLDGVGVIIVDDNATSRRVLAETLERWGMRPLAVENGCQAIDALLEKRRVGDLPAVVLNDIDMPAMNALKLPAKIRESMPDAEVGVIALTSGGYIGEADLIAKYGICAQLSKPAKHSELLRAIIRVIAPREPKSEPASTTLMLRTDGPEGQKDLPRLRVLVAEDGLANQKLALGMLEKWGHTVVIAENGKIAAELWEKETFDLILMDLQMPELDGISATKVIRQQEQDRGGRIPIIAMTAHAMVGDRERCLAVGMDGYVTKPVRRTELSEAIRPLFVDSNAPAATAATPKGSQANG